MFGLKVVAYRSKLGEYQWFSVYEPESQTLFSETSNFRDSIIASNFLKVFVLEIETNKEKINNIPSPRPKPSTRPNARSLLSRFSMISTTGELGGDPVGGAEGGDGEYSKYLLASAQVASCAFAKFSA